MELGKHSRCLPFQMVNTPVHTARVAEIFHNIQEISVIKGVGYKIKIKSLKAKSIYL